MASEDFLTDMSTTTQGMVGHGIGSEDDSKPKSPGEALIFTNYQDFNNRNEIRAAHDFRHEFADAVKTLMQQVELVEQKQAADSARAEAGEAKVVRQIAVVQSQLEKTMSLLRAPRGLEGLHVPETERWWWGCNPLKFAGNNDAEDAYAAGMRSALERGDYRTSMYPELTNTSSSRFNETGENLQHKEDLLSMRKTDSSLRESEFSTKQKGSGTAFRRTGMPGEDPANRKEPLSKKVNRAWS